jgi:hypothetical protein
MDQCVLETNRGDSRRYELQGKLRWLYASSKLFVPKVKSMADPKKAIPEPSSLQELNALLPNPGSDGLAARRGLGANRSSPGKRKFIHWR